MRNILIAAAAVTIALGCGGKETVASKSAAAYRDAVARGIPVKAGGHGGHENQQSHEAMPGMEQSQPASATAPETHAMAGMNHAEMGHTSGNSMPGMAAMDHSKAQHGTSAGMAGMDHSRMQRGSSGSMSTMQTSGMANMDHSQMQHGSSESMAGMQHGATSGMANMDHSQMQHGTANSMGNMQHSTTPSVVVPPAPATSAGISRLNPATTLNADDLDTPAATAVSEAKKAGGQAPPHSHQHEKEE